MRAFFFSRRKGMNLFISELSGAVFQVLFFALIPFFWWLISAKKKTNFFEWIGLKKIHHEGKWLHTILITVVVVAVYGILTTLLIEMYSGGITAAGSNFAGMGITAIPAAMVYGYVRTGLSEELFFRGFLLKRVSSKCGFVVGNTIQALLFGAMHGIPFGIATQNVFVTICLTLLPGALGWYQGWLNEKRCGGTIVSSWLLHGTINAIVACLSL